jgi:NADH-dependent peroxiredoxin subunit F
MIEKQKILDEKAEESVREVFSILSTPVELVLITSHDCPGCEGQKQLLMETSALTDKIKLILYDAVTDEEKVRQFNVDKFPATIPFAAKDYGIRFYGLTAGMEFSSLLEALIMISTEVSGLEPEIEKLVRSIKKDVQIQVLVSLTCPYCPKMVHLAHQFAFLNDRIHADMVEVAEFPDIIKKYHVKGVPRTVINGNRVFDGLVPEGRFFMEVLKTVDPESYQELDQTLRTLQGRRKTRNADPAHEYEVIVIGGGPAGISAALYAARKGLDVLLITKSFGGQVNYTARVDNYLGVPEVSGPEIVEAFRDHAESFEIAESFDAWAESVSRVDNRFLVQMGSSMRYRGKSVIFCGGKEYKRLGVPGEDRLMGKGIAFCATCDAPVYTGKTVAVIGGGNSAFTALRDLIPFANELYLVHRRRTFRADPGLVKEVTNSEKIRFYTPYEVLEFLGKEQLEGLAIKDIETGDKLHLVVHGAFLEVGMEAKGQPLGKLLRLNEMGEIPVSKDMSTEVQGLFAAGDVTDVVEKQISIAVGQGALAALSAYDYLFRKGLIQRKTLDKESWE